MILYILSRRINLLESGFTAPGFFQAQISILLNNSNQLLLLTKK